MPSYSPIGTSHTYDPSAVTWPKGSSIICLFRINSKFCRKIFVFSENFCQFQKKFGKPVESFGIRSIFLNHLGFMSCAKWFSRLLRQVRNLSRGFFEDALNPLWFSELLFLEYRSAHFWVEIVHLLFQMYGRTYKFLRMGYDSIWTIILLILEIHLSTIIFITRSIMIRIWET